MNFLHFMLPVFLKCPFLIAHSVYSNVYTYILHYHSPWKIKNQFKRNKSPRILF